MSLSLSQLVAQMIVVRASGHLFDHQIRYPLWEPPIHTLHEWIENLGIGGVIFVDGSAWELAARTQELQSWAKIPLLLAADIEEGVGQRFAGATWFPPPMAIAAIAKNHPAVGKSYAKKMGDITAQEALAIGLNWILGPVVDVNNNPDNPVINIRSFGEDTATVIQLTTAFMRGASHYPVLTTAKHFPGHGDTATDSHVELPVIPHSMERLREIELPPFREAIAQGVDAVMTAHLLIPNWDKDLPATLSPYIINEKLRQTLGFNGLVVTDALVMGAIADQYGPDQAPVLAVLAGADILLMPVDPEVAIKAVCDAVNQGKISRERIEASVERIFHAKQKVCPDWHPEANNNPASSGITIHDFRPRVCKEEAMTLTHQILSKSLQSGNLPLTPQLTKTGKGRNLIIVDDLINIPFLDNQTEAIATPAKHDYELQLIDSHAPDFTNYVNNQLDGTILQVFIRGNAFRNSAILVAIAQKCYRQLIANQQLQALVIYGSPYTLELFLPELPENTPYIFTYGQMPEAQAIVMKHLFAHK